MRSLPLTLRSKGYQYSNSARSSDSFCSDSLLLEGSGLCMEQSMAKWLPAVEIAAEGPCTLAEIFTCQDVAAKQVL